MNDRTGVLAAVLAVVALFLAVQLGALALVEPFHDAEHQVVEDPDDPVISLLYFLVILLMTGFMLAAFKYDAQWVIRAIVVGVSAMLAWFVFAEVVPPFVVVYDLHALALLGALAVGVGLLAYPEWYVIDAAGVVMGAGAAGLFGISFGLLPALLLLAALAIYDAISVYKTKHMLSLAEGVMDLKIPVVLVVPTTLSYSYLATDSTAGVIEGDESAPTGTADGSAANGGDADGSSTTDGDDAGDDGTDSDDQFERDALFIGLGDAIIPTILVASAAYFIEEGTLEVPLIALNLSALGAMVGTLVGLVVLLYMVLQGRAHAGLPLLNGGAITGYVLGALASGVSLATALGF
ncbi:presenilin family intramembrane aspartyl protease PSH [Natronobiforma cellulositropha]|uniref:presenilin family intramembrane aspartyl protease PSH n=1 Tax=Natronobiforma cellulositropha TaxID=1679076 RepID=UPI0021D6110C|nr:presenilin family intramembrane aspartyl protease PSH [Natronobiforma cellulositropha]